ncbi:ABC transporter substrate-binding protein [Litchfieldella rifensis]|uniref:ABC transporter substrate-binding protein n=1 Tax=Litchfieldella rifensis TaxID=762643 RepID=A0ABV7LMS6_9GAMM
MNTLLRALPVALLCLVAGPALAAEKIVYAVFWDGCTDGCEAFVETIEGAGIGAEVLIRDARQDRAALPGFVEEARALDADLVLTFGTSVTLGMAGRISDTGNQQYVTDRPLVFMYVADPFGTGIAESFERSGRSNVTGTFNRVPEAVNIRVIRTIQPEFDHLGILFHSNERNSLIKVEEMRRLSQEMDFELTALEIDPGNDEAPDPALIPGGVAALAEAGVDFIYVGSSTVLRAQRAAFTAAAIEHGLPILSPYEEVVRDGQGLVSIAARARDVGHTAGEQALRILRDGATPGDLPIARVTEFAYVVNSEAAKKLGIAPPVSFLQVAEIVR